MLDEIRALLILQDRDRRLLALAKDLARLPQDETRAKSKLAADEAAVSAAHDALIECDLRLKRLDLDAGTRRTTIQRLKIQQFETRKNEEYQALGHEIIRYGRELDEFETKELEAMEEMDAFKARQRAAEEARAKSRTLVDEDLAQVAARRERMEAEVREIEAERKALAAAVPEELLPTYERLMKTKDGLALAPLRDDKCGGCHMKLIASTIVAVHNGSSVNRCENCGRILHSEE